MNFKAGDLVRHKSGGPQMAIDRIIAPHEGRIQGNGEEIAVCKWFDKSDRIHTDEFATAGLYPAKQGPVLQD